MCEVYPPSEDTFLFLEALKEEKFEGRYCLEIGVGSGVITEFLAENNTVDGVDIIPRPLRSLRGDVKNAEYFTVIFFPASGINMTS